MKTTLKIALLIAVCGTFAHGAESPQIDCVKLSLKIKEELVANQSLVLQIVEKAVLANQDCACEIVKAAITATQADNKLIASIVEVAAVTAPEKMRLVAQCAVAVAPDSLVDVQAVLAKLDPGTGEGGTSGKEVDAKSGMEVMPASSTSSRGFSRRVKPVKVFLFQPFKNDKKPSTKNEKQNFDS